MYFILYLHALYNIHGYIIIVDYGIHNFKDITKAKKGFSQILALIGSTILAERILVPLIATPCAEKVEKKLFHKDDKTKIENILKLWKKL